MRNYAKQQTVRIGSVAPRGGVPTTVELGSQMRRVTLLVRSCSELIKTSRYGSSFFGYFSQLTLVEPKQGKYSTVRWRTVLPVGIEDILFNANIEHMLAFEGCEYRAFVRQFSSCAIKFIYHSSYSSDIKMRRMGYPVAG